MLTPFLGVCQPLMDSEVPVHVCSFLLLPFFVGLKTAAALCTWRSEAFVQKGYEVRAWAGKISMRFKNKTKKRAAYILREAGFSWTSFGISERGDLRATVSVGGFRKGKEDGNPAGKAAGKFCGLGALVAGTAGSIPAALNLSNSDEGSGTAAGSAEG